MKKKDNQFKIVSSRGFFTLLLLYSMAACGPTNNSNTQQETATVESTPDLLLEMNNIVDVENQTTETAVQKPELTEPVVNEITSTQVKLNPPHGEPDHRCDIPVGAPLDSQPTNTATTTTAVQPTNTTTVTTVTPTVTSTSSKSNSALQSSKGRVGPTIENLNSFVPSQPINSNTGGAVVLNPPHGQPGHRCDIPVGEPLPATASNNVRLNPPHGQPGHRCDIPVGSPLPS